MLSDFAHFSDWLTLALIAVAGFAAQQFVREVRGYHRESRKRLLNHGQRLTALDGRIEE